jgi:hypothetical protein
MFIISPQQWGHLNAGNDDDGDTYFKNTYTYIPLTLYP